MLQIAVLVKQVPNTTQVKIDPVTNNLVREGVPSIVNPFDMFAIEEAVRLKERFGAEITVISMGPLQAEEVIRYAFAMGADRGILLSDRAFAGADTLATSYTLSLALQMLDKVDIVLTGKQAADGDTAQVPAELAQHMGMGCLTYVTEILDITDGSLIAYRNIDVANVKASVSLPAVLTLEKGINDPRFPRILDMVRATDMDIQVLKADDVNPDRSRISLDGSPTQVMKVFSPDKKKNGARLEGNADEQTAGLMEMLAARELV